MKTGAQILEETRARIREIDTKQALDLHGRGEAIFLDVRDQPEVNLGKIPGATHISRGNLESKIEAVLPRDREVVIYCANGNRSVLAAATLEQMGYGNVCSLAGGFRVWAEQGGEIDG